MSIFKSKTEDHIMNKKLVGVHVLKEDAHRIALYAVANKVPRTVILKKIINAFLKQIPTSEKLIEMLADHIVKDWQAQKDANENKTGWNTAGEIRSKWWDYRSELKKELEAKRLPKNLVQDIIKSAEKQI